MGSAPSKLFKLRKRITEEIAQRKPEPNDYDDQVSPHYEITSS